MTGEYIPDDEGPNVPDAQDFLDPDAPPPGFVEAKAQSGERVVLDCTQPPRIVRLPVEALFGGDNPNDFVAYGAGSDVQGLILPPEPPDNQGKPADPIE